MPYREITLKELETIAAPVFEKYNVANAIAFGSCARGEMHRGSDIDIAVRFEKINSGFDFIELKRKLENKLGRKVDLITQAALEASDIKDEVLSEARVIYEKRDSNPQTYA